MVRVVLWGILLSWLLRMLAALDFLCRAPANERAAPAAQRPRRLFFAAIRAAAPTFPRKFRFRYSKRARSSTFVPPNAATAF